MKITDVKSYAIMGARSALVVKVETDSGLYGVGEGGCSFREFAMAGAVRHFRDLIVGMDPFRTEHIWQILYRSAYFEGGRILTAAMSAIDIALYDIIGKALKVPVYQLLGGAARERVLAFTTVGSPTDPQCLERCQEAVALGFPAIRLGFATQPPDWAAPREGSEATAANTFEARASIAETAEALAEVRAKVDRRIPLGIDYHHRLSVAEAATFCQLIPPGSLAFLEEPIRDECPEAYASLRSMTGVPFAIGEEWSSKWQALPYIERGLTNFARLDICNIGGFTEAMKVAGWCEAHYIDLMPHNPLGPISTAASVHLCAAVNNFTWLEAQPRINEALPGVFTEMIRLEGPAYNLPTRHGLGVEFDEAEAEKCLITESPCPQVRRPDGSYTNW